MLAVSPGSPLELKLCLELRLSKAHNSKVYFSYFRPINGRLAADLGVGLARRRVAQLRGLLAHWISVCLRFTPVVRMENVFMCARCPKIDTSKIFGKFFILYHYVIVLTINYATLSFFR